MTRYWSTVTPATRGILLMSLSTVCFSLMHALVRLVSAELSPIEIAFFRNSFGFIVFVPVLMRSGVAVLRTERLGLHSLRGAMNCVAMFAFFTGLSLTPIAEATALAFTAPIFTGVLSVLLLGERFQIRRWSAIIVGFLGTLIILRPGFDSLELGPLLVLFAAGVWAATMIVIKVLGQTESSLTITAYMNLLLTIFSFGPALVVWQTPEGLVWLWLMLIGVLGTLAQLMLAQALKEAEAGLIMPFDFLKLIWTAALGYVLFAEVPDFFVWIGGSIIFLSSSYLAYRESQLRKRALVISEELPP